MPSDSRIEKLVAHYAEDRNVQLIRLQPGDLTETAENVLNHCEAAGLIVADPDDEATINRLADAIYDHEWFGVGPDQDDGRGAVYEPTARAVLAALAVKP